MPNYFARKSGDVNATDVWATTFNGTASDLFPSFTSSDTLIANSFTINLNVNTGVNDIRADTTGSATAGGHFLCTTSGVTLTATLTPAASTTAQLLLLSASNITFTLTGRASTAITAFSGTITNGFSVTGAGANVTVNGAVNSSSTATKNGILFNSTGTSSLTINGAITGGSTTNTFGVNVTEATTLTIVGNLNGGTGSSSNALVFTALTTLNITGNVTGSSGGALSYGINRPSGAGLCTVTITGNVTGGVITGSIGFNNAGRCHITVNGNVLGGTLTSSYGISTVYAAAITNVIITGTCTGTASASDGLYFSNSTQTGTLSITGNVVAGSAGSGVTHAAGDGTVTLGASVTAGTAASGNGFDRIAGSGHVTITGVVTGGSNGTAYGVKDSGSGNITINNNVSGGTLGTGFIYTGTTPGAITINGDIAAGSGSGAHGLSCTSTSSPTIAINGKVTGGTTTSTANGFIQTGNAIVTIRDDAWGGPGGYGVHNNTSTGTVTIQGKAIAGTTLVAFPGVRNATTGGIVNIEGIEYGDLGASPTEGPIRLTDLTDNTAAMHRFGFSKKTLVTTASVVSASPANVRLGTVYDNGSQTGTLAVPSVANVLSGVATDATTGTLLMTPQAFWDALTSAMNTSGSMGERLKNATTTAIVAQQLSDALTGL